MRCLLLILYRNTEKLNKEEECVLYEIRSEIVDLSFQKLSEKAQMSN